MKRLIVYLIVAAHLASCGKHSDITGIQLHPDSKLIHIDSLMQSSPDSALQTLLSCHSEYEVRGTSSDINAHYQALLTSEALYKTDHPQNRIELQTAMHYFDSLAEIYPKNDDITLLSARSHYMNGVGYYENDSVVEACKEYLETLDLMENHFKDNDFVGYKARFIGLLHTRLAGLFFYYGPSQPAIDSYKNAAKYFSRLENFNLSNTYRGIGSSYHLDNNLDSAIYYCRKSISEAKRHNNSSVYGMALSESADLYYELGYKDSAFIVIRKALYLPTNEDNLLTHYFIYGSLLAKEHQYDSAIYYLEKGINRNQFATKTVAAELLMKCYQALGDTVNMQYYKNIYGEKMDDYRGVLTTKAAVTKIYESYMKNKRQREIIDKNRHRRTNIIVISTTVLVFVFVLLYFRKKKRITIPESFNERCAQFEQTEIFRNIRGRLSANNEKMSIKNIDGKSDMALTGADLMTLRTAVDKHFDNLTQRLARQYPELNATDINCLCLALIGLSNVEIAALLGVKYNSLTNRITRLKKILNTEDNIRIFLTEMQN